MEKNLNKAQESAITHGNGPLLIIAGAGTGKTTVITERVKHLITTEMAKPSEILALTFTEKAASEMEGRIDEALPYGYTQMWVMTFHGFCDRVLKQDGFHIGLDTKFKLMTTADSLDLLKRNLYDLGLSYFAPLGNPTKFLYGLLSHFSRLQDENITPEEYVHWTQKLVKLDTDNIEEKLQIQMWGELSNAYTKYEALKIKYSLFDFGDLITKTILLFDKRPNVLQSYQKQFKYILVDEFQDTNYAQNKLVTLLAGSGGNITVVGDDDQSIYRFRGAAVSNMLQFRAHFPSTKIVTLTENYRSKQTILDAAHMLISHNNPDRLEVLENIDKHLVSNSKGLGKIEFCNPNSNTDEADYVIQKIIELHETGREFSEFAILVRANNHAEAFIHGLENAGIPYQFLGPGKLFSEPEIMDLISYLRVITDIQNDQALYRVFSSEIYNIDAIALAKFSSTARHEHKPLFEILSSSEVVETDKMIKELIETITDHISRIQKETTISLILEYLSKSGLREKLIQEDNNENLKKLQNIEKFLSKIKAFESNTLNATIQNVVDWIDLQTEINESPVAAEIDFSVENKVNILTIHSSKGLEFPIVFLVNLVSQRFPSTERREQIPIPDELIREVLPSGDFHLQEERRLFYVGLTRAKEEVYLTGAKFYGDGKREKKVSQFVSETLPLPTAVKHESKQLPKPDIIEVKAQKKVKLKSISYSQIETFKVCPLHYKLSYILKFPTPPSSAQSFGVSFHATLKDFYTEVQNGVTPTPEMIIELLAKNWKREGYTSAAHIEKTYSAASNYLSYFYNNWFKKENTPIAMEQPFSFKLHNLYVKGTIDRIDDSKNGIHIIDYKTGKNVMSQKDADKNLQLSIYALAAITIPEAPFKRKPEDVTLSLMYFDTKEIVTTRRTAKQLHEAEEEILEWAQKIEESDFSCSGNFLCRDCEYKSFCAVSLKSDD